MGEASFAARHCAAKWFPVSGLKPERILYLVVVLLALAYRGIKGAVPLRGSTYGGQVHTCISETTPA